MIAGGQTYFAFILGKNKLGAVFLICDCSFPLQLNSCRNGKLIPLGGGKHRQQKVQITGSSL